MGRIASTLDEQVEFLQNRGMIISDIEKAKEVLFDVGYYRLGFYWFPFEISYPQKDNRNHTFKGGTEFDNAVKLYYFDFNLRNLLLKALSRIEIAFRTKVVYLVSNEYKNNPTWYTDTNVLAESQVDYFRRKYDSLKENQSVIKHHHRIYPQDQHAPAWKIIEYLTLGEMVNLFKRLKDDALKNQIAKEFGIRMLVTFENYLDVIKNIRNVCAHGSILYDLKPERSIRRGPAMMKGIGDNQNLNGIVRIVLYMLSQISQKRASELTTEIDDLLRKYGTNETITHILLKISGFKDLHR